MRKLLKYLTSYKKESILAPLFKMLEAVFELLVPIVMARIIDIGIKTGDIGYILKMCGIMILLAVIGLSCSLTAQYFAAKAAVGFGTALRRDLFAHIQRLSYSDIDTVGSSTMITRMTSDINQVQSGVNMVLRLFMRSPFIVFGAMIMAFTIDWKAAMVFVITIPVLCAVVFGIMLISIPLYRTVQNRLDRVTQITRENLAGVRVIRAFNRQQDEEENFTEANDLLKKVQLFVGKITALLNPITYVIINAAIIALLWIGARQVDSGIVLQGAVVALINYMSQILVELVKLANLIITVTKSFACGNRIASLLDVQPGLYVNEQAAGQVRDDSLLKQNETGSLAEMAAGDEFVVFDHVSFTYAKAKEPSLIDLNFSVKKGQTIGIIGGTGSGKTSLINLIPHFYDATEGEVRIGGKNVNAYPTGELRSRIGIVPQKAVLFQGSIADNLRWGKKNATEAEMQRALEIAQAADVVESKQKGLHSAILQGGKNLSGGQRQRLTIARALIRRPEILILDDSASALDYATDANLRKAIKRSEDAITVFIVSQRAATIQYADQIIVLDDGRMAGMGTHAELLESCEEYREIYYSQFPKEVQADG